MKVTQEKPAFKPITIVLETRADAEALFGLVDKIEHFRCDEGSNLDLSHNEISLIVRLSNIHTGGVVNF